MGGTELEYRIAERVRAAIGHDESSVSTFVDVCGYSQDERRNDPIASAVSYRLVDSNTHILSIGRIYNWCPRPTATVPGGTRW